MALFATSLVSLLITLAGAWLTLTGAAAPVWAFAAICLCTITAGHLFVCWHSRPMRLVRRALRARLHRAAARAGRRKRARMPRAMPRSPT